LSANTPAIHGAPAHTAPTHSAPMHGHAPQADDGHAGEHPYGLAHQFDDVEQQKEAVTIGMWAFLATELMFFGGAIAGYVLYRNTYFHAFNKASGLENWFVGCINTCVLLVSSLTMAMAVFRAHQGDRKGIIKYLIVTMILGATFLGVKAYEYNHLFHERLVPGRNFDVPHHVINADGSIKAEAHAGDAGHGPPHFTPEERRPAMIFFSFYFALTGVHALHMIVGLGLLTWIIIRASKNEFRDGYSSPVEITGLYWHFVDIAWIFLYPLLYLIDRSGHVGH